MKKTKCWAQSHMLRFPAWGGSGRRVMIFLISLGYVVGSYMNVKNKKQCEDVELKEVS